MFFKREKSRPPRRYTKSLVREEKRDEGHYWISDNKLALLTLIVAICSISYFAYVIWDIRHVEKFTDEEVDVLVHKYTLEDDQEEVQGEETINLFTNGENRLIIPDIGVDVGIFEGNESALEQGIWHRYPERGNPVKGGNFILSGHRFNIGFSSDGIQRASPLFNIDRVAVGDTIEIVWQKERFTYEVSEVFIVGPNQVEIEAPSQNHILTLYTCTLRGSKDGRVVLRARLME